MPLAWSVGRGGRQRSWALVDSLHARKVGDASSPCRAAPPAPLLSPRHRKKSWCQCQIHHTLTRTFVLDVCCEVEETPSTYPVREAATLQWQRSGT